MVTSPGAPSLALADAQRANIRAQFGSSWLGALPRTVAMLARRWQLLDLEAPLPGWGAVAIPCSFGGDRAVLKLRPDVRLIGEEVDALRFWGPTGAVPRLFAEDREVGALVLERLGPAPEVGLRDVASLLSMLHCVESPLPPIPSIEWLAGAAPPRTSGLRIARRRRLFAAVRTLWALARARVEDDVDAALDRVRARGRAAAPVLLHGDLSPRNMLGRGEAPVAIDPKPRIGDPAYDVAVRCVRTSRYRSLEDAAALAQLADVPLRAVADWALLLSIGDLGRAITAGTRPEAVSAIRAFLGPPRPWFTAVL